MLVFKKFWIIAISLLAAQSALSDTQVSEYMSDEELRTAVSDTSWCLYRANFVLAIQPASVTVQDIDYAATRRMRDLVVDQVLDLAEEVGPVSPEKRQTVIKQMTEMLSARTGEAYESGRQFMEETDPQEVKRLVEARLKPELIRRCKF